MQLIAEILPPKTYDAVDSVLVDIIRNKQSGLLSFGFLVAIFLMTNGVNAIFGGFEYSYHVKEARNFFKAYFLSCQREKQQVEIDQKLNQFNHTNEGFFTIEPFRYSELSKNYWNREAMDWIKRVIDFTGAFIGLILLSPLLL